MIRAYAGSAKTTTLVMAARGMATRGTLFLAFNKRIAEELQAKLPGYEVRTFNSLGYRALLSGLGQSSLDPDKVEKLAREITGHSEFAAGVGPVADAVLQVDSNYRTMLNLVEKAKLEGIVPGLEGPLGLGMLVDNPESWLGLFDQYDLTVEDCNNEEEGASYKRTPDEELRFSLLSKTPAEEKSMALVNFARWILHASNQITATIDFSDQLYLPLVKGVQFKKYQTILCDEAQDLSAVQHEILARSLSGAGKTICCGDERQAVYMWRAARENGMRDLTRRFSCDVLELPICYRCPTTVIEAVQQLVPGIQPWDKAEKGTIVWCKELPAKQVKRGDLVVSRWNSSVADAALAVLRQKTGVPVAFLGKDVAGALLGIASKWKKPKNIRDFRAKFITYMAKKIRAAEARRETAKADRLCDRLDTMCIFMNELDPDQPVKALSDLLRRVFSSSGKQLATDRDSAIWFGSIHSVKGLEFDRVYLTSAGRMGLSKDMGEGKHIFAKPTTLEDQNLAYVAMTRAKKALTVVND